MKKHIILLISLTIYTYACSGNCMLCHPSLKDSINKPHHQILNTCISCHTKAPEGMTSCGGDCFQCHSQNKLIKSNRPEHRQLSSCKECHINKEDLFKSPGIDNSSNLLDLLNQQGK